MKIITFSTPWLKSNMYLIEENRHGILIDPCNAPGYVEQIRENVDFIEDIILTHEHIDHISGTNILRNEFACPVLCGKVCAQRIQSPTKNFSRYFNAYAALQTGEEISEALLPVPDYVTYADQTFWDTDSLCWQGHRIALKETPGHSPGSICILIDQTILFTGDSLLSESAPMTRFPGGSKRQFEEITLPYLRELPPDILVYPGHYASFLLGNHPSI